MNKLTRFLLYLLVFTIPFENLILIPVVYSLSNLLTIFIVVSSVFAVLINGKIKRIPFAYALLILFSTFIIASLYWGENFDTGMTHLIFYLQSFFITWVIFEFIDTRERVHKVLSLFVLGCSVLLIQAIYSHLTTTAVGALNYRFFMDNYNANAMGIMWVLGIAISLYLMFNVSKKYFTYIPFAIFMILLTASRTALIILLIVMLAAIWYIFSRKIKYRKTIVLIATIVTIITISFVPQAQLDRLGTIDEQLSGGDLSGRTYIWRSGILAFQESPFFGKGVGSFKEASLKYSTLGTEMSSHNSYLTVLVETGIFGFFIFVLFLLMLFISAVRIKGDTSLKWLSTMIIILWLTLSFASHAELQKYTWVLFGIVITSYNISKKSSEAVKQTFKPKKKRRKFKRYRIVWSK